MNGTLFLDYLGFTFHPDRSLLAEGYSVFDLFKIEFPEFSDLYNQPVKFSRGFYDSVVVWNDNIRLSYNYNHLEGANDLKVFYANYFSHCDSDGRYDGSCPEFSRVPNEIKMGVNVEIPSHGLEWFFVATGLDKTGSFVSVFEWLREHNCTPSRLDITFDDFSKTFRPKYFQDKAYEGCIRTYFKSGDHMADTCFPMEFWGTCVKGSTFYLGSRAGKKFMRIYDKDIQSNGEIDSVRYEVEYHGQQAIKFALSCLENGVPTVGSWLCSLFEVIDVNSRNTTNRSMIKLDSEFSAFVESLNDNLTLCYIPKYSLRQREKEVTRWATEVCIPQVAGLISVYGWSTISKLLKEFPEEDLPSRFRKFNDSRDDWISISILDDPFANVGTGSVL